MTALVDRRSARAEAPAAGAPRMPQVDLTPPEVRAGRSLKHLRRRLMLALAGVVVVVALGAGAAFLHAGSAANALTEAQADTSRLLAEQEKYAEVPVVMDRLDALTNARLQGTSTEILWTPYLAAILSVLPEGMQLGAIGTSGATPISAGPGPADPLQATSAGTIMFTARSQTVFSTGGWIDSLNALPGFQDAWVSTVEAKEDEEDGPYYEVTSTVQVTVDAYAGRFAETEED